MTTGSWSGEGRRPRIALPRPRLRWLISPRGVAVLGAVVLLVILGWFWFRSSSFVKIKQVTVTGLSGPDVRQIREALVASAESMTTLNLSVSKLDEAVSAYSAVTSLTVSTKFPHGATIAVDEQVPMAEVTENGRMTVVDAAGQLLPNSTAPHGLLPNLPLRSASAGDRITSVGAIAALRVLGAAPYRFIGHVASATSSAQHGVIVRLRNGPQLYFGPTQELSEKWQAALAVLADSSSRGAAYIDISDPRRPAAGGATQSGGGSSTTGSANSSTTTTTPAG